MVKWVNGHMGSEDSKTARCKEKGRLREERNAILDYMYCPNF